MFEVMTRRFSGRHLDWQSPDLILVDGGKGQLGAATKALGEKQVKIPVIGLAKREEEIVIHKQLSNVSLNAENHMVLESDDFYVVRLPKNSHIVKLLQRIRDESHRFAVSYHTTLKRQNQTVSVIDSIPGVGPLTRKKLVRSFGSVKGIKEASEDDIAKIVGIKKAKSIKRQL